MQVLSALDELLDIITGVITYINPHVSSDLYVALSGLEAACEGAYANVLINLPELSSKKEAGKLKREINQKRAIILKTAKKFKATIKF